MCDLLIHFYASGEAIFKSWVLSENEIFRLEMCAGGGGSDLDGVSLFGVCCGFGVWR